MERCIVNGVEYRSVMAACKVLDIKYTTYKRWERDHRGPSSLADFLVRENMQGVAGRKRVIYKSKSYSSLASLFEQFSITGDNFRTWVKRHYGDKVIAHNEDVTELLDNYLLKHRPTVKSITSTKDIEVQAVSTVHKNLDKPQLSDLAEFRLLSPQERDELLDASDEQIVEILKGTGKVSLDGIIELENMYELTQLAHVDIREIYYLGYVCDMDYKEAIRLARSTITLADLYPVTATREVERYCEDCGEVIEHRFLESHPHTHYCRCCYDKHHK